MRKRKLRKLYFLKFLPITGKTHKTSLLTSTILWCWKTQQRSLLFVLLLSISLFSFTAYIDFKRYPFPSWIRRGAERNQESQHAETGARKDKRRENQYFSLSRGFRDFFVCSLTNSRGKIGATRTPYMQQKADSSNSKVLHMPSYYIARYKTGPLNLSYSCFFRKFFGVRSS